MSVRRYFPSCTAGAAESQNYKRPSCGWKEKVLRADVQLSLTLSFELAMAGLHLYKEWLAHLYFSSSSYKHQGERHHFLGPPAGWSRAALFFPAGDVRVSFWTRHLATTVSPLHKKNTLLHKRNTSTRFFFFFFSFFPFKKIYPTHIHYKKVRPICPALYWE